MGHYAIQGHQFWYQSKAHIRLPISDYLLSCIVSEIWPSISTKLHLTNPTEGFPWGDLHKLFHRCQQMAKVPNGVERLRKISTG